MQKKIQSAKERRRTFLAFFRKHGVKMALDNPAKLYTGKLSPGCEICMDGAWSCLYVNGLCTRGCFYCPQDRTRQTERLPMSQDEGIRFRSPADYVQYLKTFNFRGVGISGGEPFLVFDRVVEYLKAIRRTFGPKFYTWIYTNGDLVTLEKLSHLKALGLNEIRFDISANHYDLTAVRMAAKHFDTVTIEIPAIPEDAGIVIRKLRQIERAGVKFLNIHQLMVSEHNRKALIRRGYTFLAGPFAGRYIPVLESELAAYAILKAAARMKLRTSVNYCSTSYKARFQGSAYSRRYAAMCRTKNDTVTEAGYIRRLSLDEAGRTAIPSDRLEDAARKGRPVFVTYSSCRVRRSAGKSHGAEKVLSFGQARFSITAGKCSAAVLRDSIAVVLFQKLFIARRSLEETADEIMARFGLPGENRPVILRDVNEFWAQLGKYEHIASTLPAYQEMDKNEAT